MKIILETPRLLLREMTLQDLDFVAAMLADPEVMRYYPHCCTREESEAWIRRQRVRYATDGFGFWLAVCNETSQAVGQAGLLMQNLDGVMQVGLGYLMHRPFWRRGSSLRSELRRSRARLRNPRHGAGCMPHTPRERAVSPSRRKAWHGA